MKNKTLKKTLLISTGLLAAGGICIGIGIAMGGSPVFYLDNEGIHLKETTACPETVQDYAGQKQLAAFEKIEVDLKYGEFSLEEGDSYSVEYLLAGDREEPVCQVENGTLIVKEGDFGETQEGNRWYFRLWGEEGERRQDDPYVKITVPKGARLKWKCRLQPQSAQTSKPENILCSPLLVQRLRIFPRFCCTCSNTARSIMGS